MIAFGEEAMRNNRQDAALSPNSPMRFFLNVRTNNTLLVDEKGGEFADLSAACRHAMRIALEVACKYPRRPGEQVASVPLALEVMDHNGAVVFRTPIR
jgi:hypothetical protein